MRAIGMLVLAVLVGACGRESAAPQEREAATISVGDGAGELRRDGLKLGDLGISTNPNSAQCGQRPDFVAILPGARIQSCAAIDAGGTVSYTVPVSPAQVKDFYKAEAQKRGFTQAVIEQGNMFGAHGKDGRGFTAMAGEQDGATTVNVIWGLESR